MFRNVTRAIEHFTSDRQRTPLLGGDIGAEKELAMHVSRAKHSPRRIGTGKDPVRT